MSAPTAVPIHSDLRRCPDPLYRSLPVRFSERFLPLGKTVQVESNSPAIIAAASRSFGRYGLGASSLEPEIVLRICVDPVSRDSGLLAPPSYRASQHLFHISCGSTNFAVADLYTGTAVGFVTPELVENESFFCNAFLECLFHVLAVHQSHTPVHCATVATDGRGILICGSSGAGKTTLAYACARANMQIISDDVVHLEWLSSLQQLVLWGNPWQLKLLPNTSEFFPELAGRPLKRRSDSTLHIEVDVPLEFPGADRVRCEPSVLVFLERSAGTRTECRPMNPSEALERLKQDIVLDDELVVQRHYSILERLLLSPAYTLTYSGHPVSAVACLRALATQ